MRPPSPRPSEAGPTDSPTQTRGVGRTPGASARPGHGSAGGQVGEKIEKEDECCSLPLRCRAGARIQMARTLPATGLPATCHLALLAALWCHRAPAASLASHKTGADSTRPPVPPSGGTRRSDPSRCGRPRPGRDDAVCGDRAIVGADRVRRQRRGRPWPDRRGRGVPLHCLRRASRPGFRVQPVKCSPREPHARCQPPPGPWATRIGGCILSNARPSVQMIGSSG
jgi:hypothetical protein